LVVTYLCRRDCGKQRIVETNESGARNVYYRESDSFLP